MSLYILMFAVCVIGIIIGFILNIWLNRSRDYDGIMHVVKNDGRLLYSLELTNEPEAFEFMDRVVFKVETSEEIPIRS